MRNPFTNLFAARDTQGGAPADSGNESEQTTDLAESIAEALEGRTGSLITLGSTHERATRAATFAAAYRSISLIAGAMAQLPPYLEAPDGYKVEPAEIDGLPPAVKAPAQLLFGGDRISGLFFLPDLIKQLATDLAITGNAFLSKQELNVSGQPGWLEYHPPVHATGAVRRGDDGRLFATYKLYSLGNSKGNKLASRTTHSARQLIHARLPSLQSINNTRALLGTAPLDAIQRSLLLSEYADEFRRDYYTGAGYGNLAFIAFAQKLEKEAAIEVEERLHRRRTQGMKRRMFNVIGGDPKITPLTVDTQASEMTRSAADFTEDVARAYGIPGSLIGIKDTTRTNAGLEELTKTFIRFCLMLYRNAIQSAITYSLFGNGYNFKFDISAFTAADLATLSQFIMATNGDDQRPGIMTPEELRGLAGDIPKLRPKESQTKQNENGVKE